MPTSTGKIAYICLAILLAGGITFIPAQSVFAQSRAGAAHGETGIEAAFKTLDRQAHWELISANLLAFETYHPQGMTKVRGTYFLSTVEILERTRPPGDDSRYDRTPGRGAGHLIAFDEKGEKTGAIKLGEGDIYHPGGIDADAEYIWVPVAEYRPGSHSIIYRVKPETLEVEEVFRFPDHIGAVIRDAEQNILYGFSWGSRRIYSWPLDDSLTLKNPDDAAHQTYTLNKQHTIDYQDCRFLGSARALCSGLAAYREPGGRFVLGGLHLIDLESLTPVWQLPVEKYTDSESPRVMTQNPFYAEPSGNGLYVHFIPEDNESRHFVFEVGEF